MYHKVLIISIILVEIYHFKQIFHTFVFFYILKMRRNLFFFTFCIISTVLFAQRGRDGNLTVSTTVEVNEYTYLTADAPAGSTTITVNNSSLNTHGRFSGNLAPGDLIMIIQMQGATLNGSINPLVPDVGQPKDSTWGAIVNYNNCGNYEFAEVNAVPSGTTITLDCPLQYSYTDTGKVQIVRVPRYNSLTINNGGTITCDQWDSAIGGIIAIEVENNTVINSGGYINADSAGFRGGRYNGEDSVGWGVGDVASRFQQYGKEKGEGIGGYEWRYTQYGGKEAMGAPGNGGGGGNTQNAGGGGGANGGVVANYINGYGNPDVSTLDNRTAWNLEYSWMSTFTSSGGGRGGYSFSGNNENPLTIGPGNINPAWATDWGGDQRRSVGGRGGRPLDYSTGKIFMAGGGGAGDQNDNYGGAGGRGGGIIYLMNYGTVSGTGQIISNGENGFNTLDPTPAVGHASGIDAAGGAGAGGTIIVNSVGNISGISITANGGTGGSQVMAWNLSSDEEAEGPGGGGGGGYIATSNGGLTETVTGGANGTTNAKPMVNFLPNGATIGGAGTSNATITNFYLAAVSNDTICSGLSATLTTSVLGNPPGGTTVEWYTTDSDGAAIATGNSYTTPTLTNTTTYYVGSCPGTYRMAITVVVIGPGDVTVSPNNSICNGSSDSLKATGGTAYSWLPASGLNNPNIANPVATPTATTTYTVSVTTPCGIVKDSVKVTVNPLPNVTLGASNNPVCAGQSTVIMASGGSGYSWSNGATTSSITVTPLSNTTYTLAVNNGGCVKDTNILITVNPVPSVTFGATNNPVCAGSPTTITATGGGTYSWSNGSTESAVTVIPLSNTTYTLAITNGGCTKDTSYTITVTPLPTITISPDTTICTGGTATISATGGGNYLWEPSGLTTSSISVSPTSMASYTVTVTKNGCSNVAHDTVNVSSAFTVNITGPNTVCSGDTITLKATGGGTYRWNTGATTDSINVSPIVATNYNVTVTNGCTVIASASVNVDKPVLSACCDTIIQSGNSVNLIASGSGSTHYEWMPPENINCDSCATVTVNPTVTTSYTVISTDVHGCSLSRIILVTVEAPCDTLIIPNVFTPANPGIYGLDNNFYIKTGNVSSWSIDIFDRWGKEVYKSTNPDKYWGGTTESGGQAPAGVYYYLINATCNGNNMKKQGFVQLIR